MSNIPVPNFNILTDIGSFLGVDTTLAIRNNVLYKTSTNSILNFINANIVANTAIGYRFWRINTSATIFGGYTSIAEITMESSVGGSNLLTGGIASASSEFQNMPQYLAAKAIDNDTTTWWNADSVLPVQWQYDFGSGNTPLIVEFKITTRKDSQDGANCAPSVFNLEYSTDGNTWTIKKSYNVTAWALGETKTFST